MVSSKCFSSHYIFIMAGVSQNLQKHYRVNQLRSEGMMIKLLFVILTALFLSACDAIQTFTDIDEKVKTRQNDPKQELHALRKTVQKIAEDSRFSTYYKSCPAADFGKIKVSFLSTFYILMRIDEIDIDCQFASEVCALQCTSGDSKACERLARALESAEDKIGKVPSRKAYALACATGSSSGCTNRGASIRYAPISGDPMSKLPDNEKYACVFSLFSTACASYDAWGCTMLGQAYMEGEGTLVDLVLAHKHFRTSCELYPEGDPCDYAKSLQEGFEKKDN